MSQVLQHQQQPQPRQFKKCKNEGCNSLITFRRKSDGSGWSVLEKDSIGQLTQHKCQYYKPKEPVSMSKDTHINTKTVEASPTTTDQQAIQQEIRGIKAQLQLLVMRLDKLERGI